MLTSYSVVEFIKSEFGVNVEATKVEWLFLIRAQNCSKAVPIGFFKVKFVLCLYVYCKVFHREACPNRIVITCHVIVVKNFKVIRKEELYLEGCIG
ncbi:hypothetical protein BpHYR1_037437 [Brachionus plicatilis]|uniref:Uncharacterized protein n=1 Tax=Brachionus plicatilis TaxID=10195 RepID=A0A3M7QSH1_BRAPC|nr:hypothetical protein BpHYR1_037437 [Brachionus plicatilis]